MSAAAQEESPAAVALTRAPALANTEEVVAALKEHYPAALLEQRISGRPILRLEIDTAGLVRRVKVEYGGGHRLFAEAAKKVAKAMRFTPALRAGELVPITVSFPVRFMVDLPPELVDLKVCKAPPQLLNREEIAGLLVKYYPPGLRKMRIGGTTVLDLAVDSEGKIWNIEVGEPSGHPELDETALSLGSFMRFLPGTEDGQLVPSLVRIPVIFRAN